MPFLQLENTFDLMNSNKAISDYYHAHVYFALEQKDRAEVVRTKLCEVLGNQVRISRLVPRPIGPHPLPMFEIDFEGKDLLRVRTLIDQNRDGLSVLIHPNTGDDLADHRDHSEWLGETLTLNLDFLKNL